MARYVLFTLVFFCVSRSLAEEVVETAKKMNTTFGPVIIEVEEKPEPEPALKPYWLTVRIDCKTGKKHIQKLDVCDSDLSSKMVGDILKVSYFFADPETTDSNFEDDLICDEENVYEVELNLKKLCSNSPRAKLKSRK